MIAPVHVGQPASRKVATAMMLYEIKTEDPVVMRTVGGKWLVAARQLEADHQLPTTYHLLTSLSNTDRLQRAAHRRCGQPLLGQELAQQRSGFRVRDRRLHAHADQAIGVVDRLPGVHRQLAAAVVGIPVIAHIQLGAMSAPRSVMTPSTFVPSGRTPVASIGTPSSSVRHAPTASKFSSAMPIGSKI